MLDERVIRVLARLQRQDEEERERGLPPSERSLAVSPETGRFLFALIAPNSSCEVLEIGGSRGYSSVWLAAGARYLGGRLVSIERDPGRAADWRRNVADAGLGEWAELIDGDAFGVLSELDDVFDVVFLDAAKDDYERLFTIVRTKLEPGGLVVADNVLSHAETLGAYSAARQADPTLSSVTVPLDSGLELTVVLAGSLSSDYHGKEVVRH